MSNVIKFSTPSTFTGSISVGIYKGSELVSNQISIGVMAAIAGGSRAGRVAWGWRDRRPR